MPTVWAPWPGKRKAGLDMIQHKPEAQARVISIPPEKPSLALRACMSLCFHFDDDAAHVVAAVGADDVLRDGGAALRAIRKLLRLFRVVRPASAGPRVRLTTLRNGHLGLD